MTNTTIEYEVACEFIRETDDAMLVYDGNQDHWIQKSLISECDFKENGHGSITIPEWLAAEKDMY